MRCQFGASLRLTKGLLPAVGRPIGRDGLAPKLSDEIGLGPKRVQRAKELLDRKVIECVGSRKYGSWGLLRHPMSQ